MVDGVVDCLHHLLLPLPLLCYPLSHPTLPSPAAVVLAAPVEHIVHIDSAVELGRADPLEEHGAAGLADEGEDVRAARGPDVRVHGGHGVAGLPLVLRGEGPRPDLVLGVGLCK